jgi:hypothetical protein
MPLVLDHPPMPTVTLLMVAGSVCACCGFFPSSSLAGRTCSATPTKPACRLSAGVAPGAGRGVSRRGAR